MNDNDRKSWISQFTASLAALVVVIAGVVILLAVRGEEGANQYQFTGVNRYDLLTTGGSPFVGCGGVFTDAQTVAWFDELETQNVNAVRVWAFQSYMPFFTRMDRVLELAGERGIKAIPVMENQWDRCTQGGFKYDTWYDVNDAEGYATTNYGYDKSLITHTEEVVDRYKDDPRILMWQIMNEAQNEKTDGTCGVFDTFKAFAADMSGRIKDIDTDTPVSFGTEGDEECGAQGAQYQSLHNIVTLDYCEFHDYGRQTESMPGNLQTRLDQCAALGKQLFIGEAGIDVDCGTTDCATDCADPDIDCYTHTQRAAYFDAKMLEARNAGAIGYLIWSYRDRAGVVGTTEYGPNDSLAAVVTTYSPIDTDNDGVLDEEDNCPTDPNPDQADVDNDGTGTVCDNCPTTATVWFVPVGDIDCDGFTTTVESHVGTDPNLTCAPPDAWPPDFNNSNVTDFSDLSVIVPKLFRPSNNPPENLRYDLAPGTQIDFSDLNIMVPFLFLGCMESNSTITLTAAFVPCSDPRGCPNLIMDSQIFGGWEPFVSVETWAATDCAVQEGLTQAGTRTLLRFNTVIGNKGPGSFNAGDQTTHPEFWVYDECHRHYHFRDAVAFRLWTKPQWNKWQRLRLANPDVDSLALLAQYPELTPIASQKQGFCFEETGYYPDYDYANAHYHYCVGVPNDPGIDAKAADGYHYSLPGQWLTVDGLRAGRYVIEQEVNPRRIIEEVDYLDNSTGETIVIPR